MDKRQLKPEELILLYEGLAERVPESVRPIQHVARLSRHTIKQVLAIAWMLDIPTHGEETEFTGQQAASIIRKLFRLE